MLIIETCKNCGKKTYMDIHSHWIFCPECGYQNDKTINLCPNCKQKVYAEWQFCTHCGKRLQDVNVIER